MLRKHHIKYGRQKFEVVVNFPRISNTACFVTVTPDHNLVPRAFPLKVGGAGKDPGIGWSRVHLTP